jgi:hypothetical protein
MMKTFLLFVCLLGCDEPEPEYVDPIPSALICC